MTAKRGHLAISEAFRRAADARRAAVIPYVTVGFPSREASIELAAAAIDGGADLLELGIPFSDPLADGPTIQEATTRALANGTAVRDCLDVARELRRRYPRIPLLFMGYANPILAFGESAFVKACVEVGVDGLIVPDLPPEESRDLEDPCRMAGLALVHLVAPGTPENRVKMLCERTSGFVYLVSVAGTTGARRAVDAGLPEVVARVRAATNHPIAVGFGISTPEHAARVAHIADGVIVGSAVIERCGEPDAVTKVRAFVSALRSASIRA